MNKQGKGLFRRTEDDSDPYAFFSKGNTTIIKD